MHSKIACDHNDHDHYADDVKDIHCFTPIEITFGVQTSLVAIQQLQRLRPRSEQKRSSGARSGKRDELAISLPALCRTLYLIAYTAGAQVALGGRPFGRGRDDILIASARRMHPSCSRVSETFRSNEGSQRAAVAIIRLE